ncbi:type 1 glutamine amidotransferase [Streptomyces sp. NPDC057611]|uniref:type 1 glutamine amidotransferase n=1 Tax=Streptomyces sp. NPDC057611 TaxID=3346182 RepID=UPI0036B412C2
MADAAETILVLQHQDDAGPGNLADWLWAKGIPWQLVDVRAGELPQPTRHRALMVLGSREAAYDATVPWGQPERSFVQAEVECGTPVFGICYGAQLLAQILDGKVQPAAEAERGWTKIPAVADEPQLAQVVQGCWFEWHGDEILLPPQATLLAGNRHVQAFSQGRHLGVQFHPEITAEQIRAWMTADQRRRQLADVGGVPEELVRITESRYQDAERAAWRLYEEFLKVADG